ncbi:hypothetical protein [Amycolatopsis echigonensis]|uniref:Uncharacterized protein n=1 Tax=Amycolatopsis echigonensis TaxID=2576905 RepID=A0A2N3WE99_9PSEU|nr:MULTISPECIES: hypothetical protein [Amycolatopsis]MBB2499643.1 hypothetical protein [Amycolatopsis echigonensis]PKV92198.1 hypothetical protein ATK30_2994 [Amycolatopsis niigatensis]
MKQAPPARRELEFRFDGTDEDLDLTELLAGPFDAPQALVEVGPEIEDLTGVADLLDEFDAELAAREAAEAAAAPVADVVALGNWIVSGQMGAGKSAIQVHALLDLAEVEAEDEVA